MSNTYFSDTGNGATITFGTSGFTARYHEIGEDQQVVAKIDTSHLGLARGSAKTHIPGDLVDVGEIACMFEWPLGTICPLRQAAETITITYPLPVGKTTPATLAGTGWCRTRATPQLKNDTLQTGKMTVVWDGLTGPTYTPAS